MLVSEVISRINLALGEPDDLTGKAINSLFSNKRIVEHLQNALDQYASITKGIESVYSAPVYKNRRNVNAPSDAIRSKAYKSAVITHNNLSTTLTYKDLEYVSKFYSNQYSGFPNVFNVWDKQIRIYPQIDTDPISTILTNNINATATTINIDSGGNLPDLDGRVTIGNEKILYQNRTTTQLNDCVRGIEGTTASSHSANTDVIENNFILHYRKKHFKILVDNNDLITNLDLEMEVCDEHIEPIVNMVAYKLLLKVDAERALPYKIDSDRFFQQAKIDITAGYSDVSSGRMIGGDPFGVVELNW